MLGAIWATYDVFVNGQKYAMLAMPLLHTFAVWNLLDQSGQELYGIDQVVGTILVLNGAFMTVLASKTEIAWNWEIFEWDDTIEYYGWIDRVGQLGIAYFLIGISWAIGLGDSAAMLWAIWAVFLSGVAIQGFRDETETPWRRGVGSMGTIFALFMLSFTFDAELYTFITWMFLGVVALGFGFAYISRMGEVSNLYSEDYIAAKEAIHSQEYQGLEAIPEAITSEDQIDDEIEEALEEDIEEEIEASHEEEDIVTPEPQDLQVQEAITPEQYNYDLQLDPTVLSAIQNSLANTPHDGFKPVVSIATNGNLKIDFIPL